jgi:hypothetical protein
MVPTGTFSSERFLTSYRFSFDIVGTYSTIPCGSPQCIQIGLDDVGQVVWSQGEAPPRHDQKPLFYDLFFLLEVVCSIFLCVKRSIYTSPKPFFQRKYFTECMYECIYFIFLFVYLVIYLVI